MPKQVKAIVPKGMTALAYSSHAQQAASDDRYGHITLPQAIDFQAAQLIEIDDIENKVLVRAKLDDKRDICIAAIPNGKTWLVKTVWINLSTDKHRTLDKSKYARQVKF